MKEKPSQEDIRGKMGFDLVNTVQNGAVPILMRHFKGGSERLQLFPPKIVKKRLQVHSYFPDIKAKTG